ncbi:diguanylate cyclase [Rhizobium sp. RU36D]|uniref:GGDEF domain-containing protein n=1 Tax=Rhizobium sp. RU36D TaxID=1907415 RepID=UPI0009D8EBC2|nr:diguanylate cyclase [Rhizobium sp. RU36D]SMC89021.1 diguanylate cyclase (GGDEF) domain-containing protein [Rhizobium sp. RU36D]
MHLVMIKKVVMAALLLPTLAMTLEAGVLIAYTYRDLSSVEATREYATLLTMAGEIASSATPDEAEAVTNYLKDPGPATKLAFEQAQAELDRQNERLDALIQENLTDHSLQDPYAALRGQLDTLHKFREQVEQGQATTLSLLEVYRPLSEAYLDLVNALDEQINDNRLLRKLDQLQAMLHGHEAGMIISAFGYQYLSGVELTPQENEALFKAVHVYDARLQELAEFEYAEQRAVLKFHNSESGTQFRDVLSHIRTRGLQPASLSGSPQRLADAWTELHAQRMEAWKADLAKHIRDTRELADSLTLQSRMHFLALITGVIVMLVLTTTVLVLATKGIRLVDRLTRDREALIQELRSASHTDVLTGMPNRRGFDAALRSIETRSDGEAVHSLVIFDLDRFKQVNDVHGHDGGDAVLAQVARVARGSFRSGDLLARHGGEEFVALLPNTGLVEAALAAEDVREAIAATDIHLPSGKTIRVTASFGCAAHHGALESGHLNAMIKKADLALYAAKFSGRNKVVRDGDFNEISMERREVRFA